MLNYGSNLKTTTLSAPYTNQLNGSKYDPLTKAEEKKLIRKYKKTHDISARNKLVNSNLRYAQTLVKPWIGQGLDYSELISEANYGLIESIDKFNPKYDIKLFSYAKWWIIERMRSAVEKKNQIKIAELPDDNEESDDDRYLYDNALPAFTHYDVPLQFIYDDATENLEEECSENKIKDFINDVTTTLTERERGIVDDYYGCNGNEPLTLAEVGKKYSICKERARQILEKAMRKIRSEAVLSEINPINLLKE
jgi:RNA polymerase primary sigma factor